MVARHFMPLTAFFVKTDPGTLPLDIDIPNLHLQSGSYSREGVDHQRDKRSVPEGHRAVWVYRIEKGTGFLRSKNWSFPLFD
jgi:hypothetical protein